MSLQIERMRYKDGGLMAGLVVVNAKGKTLAVGCCSQTAKWIQPVAKRYAKDMSLCVALFNLTGLPVRWVWQRSER